MATKKCPVCGVPVKIENLERHLRNQHPRADVDLEVALTPEERRQSHEATAAARPALTQGGKRLIAIVAVVLVIVLAIVILNPFGRVGPGVGQVAPDFTLATSTGGSVTLSSLRGSWVVLVEFMDPDCGACQNEAPTLASLYANFSARVRFLSVDVDFVGAADSNAKIASFKSTYGTSWDYMLDTTHAVTNAYGVGSTPTTFILDRNGVVSASFHTNTYAGYADLLNRALGG